MKFITLTENSDAIDDTRLKKSFLSKVERLERILVFFDKKGIKATVRIIGSVKDKHLHTNVEVLCDDDGYRKAIEENIKSFKI
jgi:hypothetical protein